MQKIMIFGKPGGGKSTFAKKLANTSGIPLHNLDLIAYMPNGEQASHDYYTQAHTKLLASDNWIIEGLGPLPSFWSRVDAADILIYIDLPYRVHYWWVIKRFFKSPWVHPEGWPIGSSVARGTLASFRNLRLSRQFWTLSLYEKIVQRAAGKPVIKITHVHELRDANVMLRATSRQDG